jgi:hypothetical protein
MINALIDCHSYQARLIQSDKNAIFRPRLPTDVRTHRSKKPALLAFVCDL